MLTIATPADIPELLPLVNSAYRSEASRRGWTTEADFLTGDIRTDADDMAALMARPDAVILQATDSDGNLMGCVFLGKTRRPAVPRHVVRVDGIAGAGYRVDDRPYFDVMGTGYRPDDPEATEEIWIPVVPV